MKKAIIFIFLLLATGYLSAQQDSSSSKTAYTESHNFVELSTGIFNSIDNSRAPFYGGYSGRQATFIPFRLRFGFTANRFRFGLGYSNELNNKIGNFNYFVAPFTAYYGSNQRINEVFVSIDYMIIKRPLFNMGISYDLGIYYHDPSHDYYTYKDGGFSRYGISFEYKLNDHFDFLFHPSYVAANKVVRIDAGLRFNFINDGEKKSDSKLEIKYPCLKNIGMVLGLDYYTSDMSIPNYPLNPIGINVNGVGNIHDFNYYKNALGYIKSSIPFFEINYYQGTRFRHVIGAGFRDSKLSFNDDERTSGSATLRATNFYYQMDYALSNANLKGFVGLRINESIKNLNLVANCWADISSSAFPGYDAVFNDKSSMTSLLLTFGVRSSGKVFYEVGGCFNMLAYISGSFDYNKVTHFYWPEYDVTVQDNEKYSHMVSFFLNNLFFKVGYRL